MAKWQLARAVVLAGLLVTGGCAKEHAPEIDCGEDGTYHEEDVGRYCAYIVIIGGLSCPPELPHRYEFETGEVVCSDQPIGGEEDLPEEVCAALGRDCATSRRSEQCRWDETFGGSARAGPEPDAPWIARFEAISVGFDGTVYVAATFNADTDFGGGVRGAPTGQATALVAFDGLGGHLWDRVLPDTWSPSIAATPSGVVIAGGFGGMVDFGGGARSADGDQAVYVAAFDGDGAHQWDRAVPASGGSAVAVTSDGGVRVAGAFDTPTDFGGGARTPVGTSDGYVLALDAGGDYLWDQTFGGAMAAVGPSEIARDATDRVYVGGGFEGTAEFGGGARTSQGPDGFVVALDATGAYRWDRVISGRACTDMALTMCPLDGVGGLAILRDGSVVVTGSYADGADFGGGPRAHGATETAVFIAAYDSDGGYRWDDVSLPVGGFGFDVAAFGDDLVVAGTFTRLTDFGGGGVSVRGLVDGFALRLTAAGDYVFEETFGGVGVTIADSVAATPAGNLIVGGSFEDSADFGHGERMAEGLDLFATRVCR